MRSSPIDFDEQSSSTSTDDRGFSTPFRGSEKPSSNDRNYDFTVRFSSSIDFDERSSSTSTDDIGFTAPPVPVKPSNTSTPVKPSFCQTCPLSFLRGHINMEMTIWSWATLFICSIIQPKLVIATVFGVIKLLISCICILAILDFIQMVAFILIHP